MPFIAVCAHNRSVTHWVDVPEGTDAYTHVTLMGRATIGEAFAGTPAGCTGCGNPIGTVAVTMFAPDADPSLQGKIYVHGVCRGLSVCYRAAIERARVAGPLVTDQCAWCGDVGRMYRCTLCHRDSYCGYDCQKADWPNHRATRCGKSTPSGVIQSLNPETSQLAVHRRITTICNVTQVVINTALRDRRITPEAHSEIAIEIQSVQAEMKKPSLTKEETSTLTGRALQLSQRLMLLARPDDK